MFGLVIVFRILSHLRKFEVLNQKKMIQMFFLFQIPIYFPLFFKELFPITLIYIGIILTSLIFFQKILSFFIKRTHQLREIAFIDEIILLMKSGKSAQTSLKMTYSYLSEWEKSVFKPILFCFEHENLSDNSVLKFQKFYFEELEHILKSSTKVIDQLISFRDGLKIQRNLRHKSGQVTQQIRAQAVVALFIYCGIFTLSWMNFRLSEQRGIIVVSVVLFVAGQSLVFLMGGRIKWKT